MKLNLIVKMLPIEMILALELKINQNLMKGLCFDFPYKISISTLTLRRQIAQIYIFKLQFSFFKDW